MTIVFESILPVFLLVILGVALRRSTLVDQGLWIGLEQFGYYFLFPALLFSTLAKADLAGLEADATAVATVGSVTLMSAALLSAWPLLRRGGISGPTFTSVFQTATRWNAFIALAVAEKTIRHGWTQPDGSRHGTAHHPDQFLQYRRSDLVRRRQPWHRFFFLKIITIR